MRVTLSSGLVIEQSDITQGDGADLPALFCLHGIGGDSRSFALQQAYFKGKRRFISWNMPGYGGSKALPQMSFAALADALVDALNECALTRVVLVGQSIGGMLALEMAHRYPERVAALVLIATTPAFGGRDEQFKTTFLQQRLAPLDAGQTLPQLAQAFVPQIVGPIACDAVIEQAQASMAAVPASSYRAAITCLVTFNRRDDLAAMHMPALVLSGREDQNAPARTMQKMANTLPNARHHSLEGVGHLVNLEAAETCNQLIDHFLGDLV